VLINCIIQLLGICIYLGRRHEVKISRTSITHYDEIFSGIQYLLVGDFVYCLIKVLNSVYIKTQFKASLMCKYNETMQICLKLSLKSMLRSNFSFELILNLNL